jgi:hypothetical protein
MNDSSDSGAKSEARSRIILRPIETGPDRQAGSNPSPMFAGQSLISRDVCTWVRLNS